MTACLTTAVTQCWTTEALADPETAPLLLCQFHHRKPQMQAYANGTLDFYVYHNNWGG